MIAVSIGGLDEGFDGVEIELEIVVVDVSLNDVDQDVLDGSEGVDRVDDREVGLGLVVE